MSKMLQSTILEEWEAWRAWEAWEAWARTEDTTVLVGERESSKILSDWLLTDFSKLGGGSSGLGDMGDLPDMGAEEDDVCIAL